MEFDAIMETKGVRADFLRENARFLNEPICTIERNLPTSTSTVADCLRWNAAIDSPPPATSRRPSTGTLRCSYRACSTRLYIPSNVPHHCCHTSQVPLAKAGQAGSQLIKRILDPEHVYQSNMKERISFKHQYNCRTDPNEPNRGKLHGSFVWD